MTATGRPFLRRGPSGPLADRDIGDIQDGYDQVVEALFVPDTVDLAFFPRNADGDPLKVTLPDVRPGNFLEVDIRLNLAGAIGDGSYPTDFTFTALAVVTFDGTDPAVPSTSTFFVLDSWTGSHFRDTTGEGITPDKQSMSSLCAVEIPDGATEAIVEVMYLSDGVLQVNSGTDLETNTGLGATLKVCEKGVNAVTQTGPGNLLAST